MVKLLIFHLIARIIFIKGSNLLLIIITQNHQIIRRNSSKSLQNNDKNIVVYVHCDSGRDRKQALFHLFIACYLKHGFK